jgi:metallo-beta-lactamase class B
MNGKKIGKSTIPLVPPHSGPGDLTPIEPSRLFYNFYFVGTKFVGSFVIDTTDGLIMIDTGWGEMDCSQFVNDMKKLGLNPGNIRLILISHEHLDHYGGVQYLKKNVCPDAKVALSTVGWYHLQVRIADVKPGGMWDWPKQQSIDVFLTDGQKITLGNTVVQIVYTPGHAPGCVSFIIPVTDNGTQHMVGILGGSGLLISLENMYLYKASIDYFQQFTREAKCDVGISVHFWGHEAKLTALRVRKPGDANPFVIGTEKFESEYLQQFKDRCLATIKQSPPEVMPPPPPWIK